MWNQYLVKKLTSIGFKQSTIDECLFYKGRVMYALYTDDSILAGPCSQELDKIVKQMKDVNLNITEEVTLEDFLGVNIDRQADGTIHLTQPQLIESILKDLRLLVTGVHMKPTPSCSSRIL